MNNKKYSITQKTCRAIGVTKLILLYSGYYTLIYTVSSKVGDPKASLSFAISGR